MSYLNWISSYIAGNSSLIIGFVALIAALGAFAFFARDWRALVAALAVLAIGMGIQQIDKNAYQRAASEQAAAKVAILQGRLDALNKAAEADAMRAQEDALYIAALESQANVTPPNAGACLPEDAAKRIGAIK